MIDSVVLRNYFGASSNNRLDAQILQTDKVLFRVDACHLSAKNGERASLKSATSENFESEKKIN